MPVFGLATDSTFSDSIFSTGNIRLDHVHGKKYPLSEMCHPGFFVLGMRRRAWWPDMSNARFINSEKYFLNPYFFVAY